MMQADRRLLQRLSAALLLCALAALLPRAAQGKRENITTAATTSIYLPLMRGTGTAPTVPPDEQVPLGVNLEGLADYAHSRMFVDAMKMARSFGSAQTPWDGNAPPADASGWPQGDFGAVIIVGGGPLDGTYKLSFTGQARVIPVASNAMVEQQRYDAATNLTTADVVVDPSAHQLMLSFRDTGAGIQDVRLIRPGYPASTTQTFHTPFLERLKPFSVLRLMDYSRTNNNPVAEWSERTAPTRATQANGRGGAWEYAIELANEADKDIWVNVPHKASDDYVRKLAQLLDERLEPGRRVYVEYSNEVWNPLFSQQGYNLEQAKAEVAAGGSPLNADGSTEPNAWAHRRVGKRSYEISQIFREIFGDAAINTRVRVVLAGQWANSWVIGQSLRFFTLTGRAPADHLYAIAGAPYFNISGEMSKRTDLTAGEILTVLEADIASQAQTNQNYAATARYYGLRHLSYEGGPHLTGAESLAAKTAANRDPLMRTLIRTYLTEWYANGGDLFMYFSLTGSSNQYGFWWLTEDVTTEDTPKFQGALDVLRAPRPAVNIGQTVPGILSALAFVGAPATTAEPYLRNMRNGASKDYLLNVGQAGVYALQLSAALRSGTQPVEVWLNNRLVTTLSVASTGGPEAFADTEAVPLQLDGGVQVVRLRFPGDGPNVKSLVIWP